VKITVSVAALAMVLAEPGRPNLRLLHVALPPGPSQRPTLVYQDHPTRRAGDVGRTFLGDSQGTVLTDLLPAKK